MCCCIFSASHHPLSEHCMLSTSPSFNFPQTYQCYGIALRNICQILVLLNLFWLCEKKGCSLEALREPLNCKRTANILGRWLVPWYHLSSRMIMIKHNLPDYKWPSDSRKDRVEPCRSWSSPRVVDINSFARLIFGNTVRINGEPVESWPTPFDRWNPFLLSLSVVKAISRTWNREMWPFMW